MNTTQPARSKHPDPRLPSENHGSGNGGSTVDLVAADTLTDEIGEVAAGDLFGALVAHGGDLFWGEAYGGLAGVDAAYGGDGAVVANDLLEVEVIA